MKLFIVIGILATVVALLFLTPDAVLSFDGPLWDKNEFPLFLALNSPTIEKAAIESSLTFHVSYSSVFVTRTSPEWVVNADMEMAALTFQYRHSFDSMLELGIDVPVLVFTSGFLDGFLNTYHDAFGFSDYGRPSRPNNEFLYEVKRKGDTVIKGENGSIGLGDIRLSVKKPLLDKDLSLSIRAEVELPTGNAKTGYGNGSIGLGAALLMDKDISDTVRMYLNFGGALPGDYKGYDTIKLRGFMYVGAAVEASPWQYVSLIGQVTVQNSPFPKTGIDPVDDIAVRLTLGGRYTRDLNSFEFAFTEDLSHAGVPDFTVVFSFKRRL